MSSATRSTVSWRTSVTGTKRGGESKSRQAGGSCRASRSSRSSRSSLASGSSRSSHSSGASRSSLSSGASRPDGTPRRDSPRSADRPPGPDSTPPWPFSLRPHHGHRAREADGLRAVSPPRDMTSIHTQTTDKGRLEGTRAFVCRDGRIVPLWRVLEMVFDSSPLMREAERWLDENRDAGGAG